MFSQLTGRADIAIELDGLDAEFIAKPGEGCVPVRLCGLYPPDLSFCEGEPAPALASSRTGGM